MMDVEEDYVGPLGGADRYLRYSKGTATKPGLPLPTVGNIKLILQHDPRWAGRLWRNVFTDMNMITTDGHHRTIEPADVLDCWDFLQVHYGMDPSKDRISDAIDLTATRKGVSRDPLVNELLRCHYRWEEQGKPKGIHSWLFDYLGVAPVVRDEDYTKSLSAVGSKFLISLIARALRPGSKVDNVLILEGAQGSGKSTAFSILGGEYFSDSSIDIRSKDAYQSLPGVWIHEFAELDSMRKRESTAIKAFLSSKQDRYRPSYGRSMVEVKRRTVFVGTTNEGSFLTDSTGNRRFWPVKTGKIRLDELKRQRDYLLGEAVQAFRDGQPWHLTADEDRQFSDMRSSYLQTHPWAELIADFVRGSTPEWARWRALEFITTQDILMHCLEMPKDRWTKSDKSQIGDVMSLLGWQESRQRVDGRQLRGWTRP